MPGKQHYPSLDGLRGLAILAVFVRHYLFIGEGGGTVRHIASSLWSSTWMGVDLFFCISGFLITGILFDARGGSGFFRNFYMRRILRIFPVYYACLLALFLMTGPLHIGWRVAHVSLPLYLSNIAFPMDDTLRALSPQLRIGHLWSLAVEEQFYFVWPLIVYFAHDRKQLLKTALLIGSMALPLRLILYAANANSEWNYCLLFTRMDALLCGAILALLARGDERARVLQASRFLLPVSGALVVGFVIVRGGYYEKASWAGTWGFTAIALASTSLIAVSLDESSLAGRIFRSRVLGFVGKYSYGLYLYHYLLREYLWQATRMLPPLHWTITFALQLAICLAISVVSYHVLEMPFLRLKSRFEYREAPAPGTAVLSATR